VAETLEPGAVIADVGRRWQVCPQQVFTWRRAMLHEPVALTFAAIEAEAPAAVAEPSAVSLIAVELAGAVLRIGFADRS
jgi:transposase